MARRRTSEASKDSKQQKDKKKHAKRNNESSDEEKDAEEAKTSKAEKSNSSDLSRVLIPTVMVVGGAVVSAASTYFASRNAGHAQFLEEFRQVVEDAEAALESAQHWVRERERLYLPVPQLVRDDIRKLKDLCDLCYRLDDSSDRWKLIPGYVILGLGGISVAAAALTGGVVDETTGGFVLNLAAKAGAAGLSVGTAWVVGVLGLRSSSVYTSSYELYASRIISTICSPAWVNTERHARAVRETLAAPELHSQVHAPPAAVPEGARVRQEMRQQDLPDVPSDEPLIDFERPPSPLGVDVGIPRYRTRRQETPKLEPLSI
ncbi:hypothetical protein M427DRAFT_135784 [Gonapodya prolifera JEL478]|uniref:Transmembrane protein n=1 Tax=Gonapodya prolifera (strain JEL478) TaxID=1344416 RepID=A0A139AC79_GONPJ|nr:hypothetical protein M427DRAFT_135784 [Gonapodya prolifera JEL478]|eukprot:KXS14412.1 hypothetical protein M427DRAFT_135784 [Gonapodya prolifera JEL478]